jgi:peptide/nickel transport system substrate-binding protein
MRNRSLLLCLAVLTAACGERASRGAAGAEGGTMVISTGGEADGFLPPLTVNVTSGQVEAQVFDKLAEPGVQLNMVGDVGFEPRLAASWSWAPDSLSIAFHVDPKARWHDGQKVTAKDVRFTFQIYTDSAVGSLVKPLLLSIDSVTVRDSLTAVFWYTRRSPGQFFDAASQMRILPEHILGSVARADIKTAPFRRSPVGSGPFKFVRWDDRQAIVVEANKDYHLGRPHLDRVIWSIAPDPSAAVLRLFAGETDFLETLRPADTVELAKHPEIVAFKYPSFSVGFVAFNERDPKNWKNPHPIFGDRDVRRALSMAIDRQTIVNSVFNGRATVGSGPVPRSYATYDSTIVLLPYSPDSAKRILDARGWKDTKGTGVREKNGLPLAFRIMAPSSSTPRRQMAELMQEAYKQIGAKVEVEMVDYAATIKEMTAHNYDASIVNLSLDPVPSSARQSWGSASAEAGGSNYGMYESKVFDAYIDSAAAQMDPVKARAYYRKAYVTIIGDAPALWLYEPGSYAGVQKRIHPVKMRADAWYANIREWYIPADERTERDRSGEVPTAAPAAPPAAPAKP